MSKVRLRSNYRRDSEIEKVVTRWDYTEGPSPAFKRLMMLLLKPRVELEDKEGSKR